MPTDTNGASGNDRPLCGSKRVNSNQLCTRPAGWGTSHPGQGNCKKHAGSTPNHVTAARRELARQAVEAYGLRRDIPADEALLEEVHRTAGHVQALGAMVAEIPRDDLAWGIAEQTTRRISLGDKDQDAGGAGDVDGVVVDTKRKAAPHVLINMYLTERKHLVDVCKTVAGLEIEDRRVRLAEEQGAVLAGVIKAVLTDLHLSPEQWAKVPEIVPRHLRAVADEEPA